MNSLDGRLSNRKSVKIYNSDESNSLKIKKAFKLSKVKSYKQDSAQKSNSGGPITNTSQLFNQALHNSNQDRQLSEKNEFILK